MISSGPLGIRRLVLDLPPPIMCLDINLPMDLTVPQSSLTVLQAMFTHSLIQVLLASLFQPITSMTSLQRYSDTSETTTISSLKASSFPNATAISQIYTSCSKINGSRLQRMSMCSMQAMTRTVVCACFYLLVLTKPTTFSVPQFSKAIILCINS